MKLLILGANESLHRSIVQACGELAMAGASTQVQPTFLTGSGAAALRAIAGDSDTVLVIDRAVTPSVPRAASDEVDRDALRLAADGGCARIVFVRAADDGTNPPLPANTTIVRSSPVYGIGDDPITLLLIMMRSLPAVPILDETRTMQPIFHEDFSRVIAAVLTRPASSPRVPIEIAGPDVVTQPDLYERIAALIDRRPVKLPIPEFLATYGGRLAEALKLTTPFDASHLHFAVGHRPLESRANALTSMFFFQPTTIDRGLRRLVEQLDEVTPVVGTGSLEVKRFYTVIEGSSLAAPELLREFCQHFGEMMPIDVGVEPVAPQRHLSEGAILTMNLPGRGHVQVRVQEVTDRHAIVATLRGHVVAGVVRFSATPAGTGVRFEVMPCDTAANPLDWMALTLGGARLQDLNWSRVVQNVVKLSGGQSDGVHFDEQKLSDDERAQAERWITGVVDRQRTR